MSHIYILRHGEAGGAAPGLPDSSRTLTKNGFADIKLQARRLAARAPDIERIFCSPLVRARQTGALVHQELDADFEITDSLVPGGNAEQVLDMLAGIEEEVLLVSHMPLVGELVSRLTGTAVPFHQGTCVKVERPDAMEQRGSLAWTLHPS